MSDRSFEFATGSLVRLSFGLAPLLVWRDHLGSESDGLRLLRGTTALVLGTSQGRKLPQMAGETTDDYHHMTRILTPEGVGWVVSYFLEEVK